MRHDRRQRKIGAAALALAVLAWSSAGAAEAASSPGGASSAPASAGNSENAPPGSAISGARRELDAIKALRDPAQTPKGALPKLTMPELHTVAPDVQPWSNKPGNKPDAATKQPANWLVDAMMKEDRRAERARDGKERGAVGERGGRDDSRGAAETASGRSDNGVADVGSEQRTVSDSEPRGEPRDAARDKEPRDAANPLNRYLGEWLTPRDYAILKPGLDDAAAGGRANGGLDPRIAATLGADSVATAVVPGIAVGDSGAGLEAVRQGAPKENPYLEAMQPIAMAKPPGIVPLPAPISPQAGVQSVAPAGAAPNSPPLVAPPKSKIPDFAKPAQDEKYFKQLKRF